MSASLSHLSRRKALGLMSAAGAAALLNSQSAPVRQSNSLRIAGQRAELWATLVSSYTLRLSLLPVSEDGGVQPISERIILTPRRWPSPAATLHSTAESRVISWGNYQLRMSGSPPQLVMESHDGRKIQQLDVNPQSGSVSFLLHQEPVWGLGEGGRQFDRRGALYPMHHGERVPDLRTNGARMPIPWLVSPGGWALFFHVPFGTFDLRTGVGVFQPDSTAQALPLDIFCVAAKNPEQILQEYARLTGFPHMPPVWALGYQQSHRTLASREEVLAEAATFRQKKLSCDVLIYLGTGFCPSGWNTGHGSYKFNPHVFPYPKAMIDKLHAEDFCIVLHEDKPPKQLHGRASDSGAAAEDPEDAAYYWREHLKVFDLGVDGWWADEGDWLDNLPCLVRNRMYWEGAQMARPNVRPYVLNRNGYAGIQRYGWLWSGDIDSTWETLRAQIAVGINTGLSGMPYWGTDTGGFLTTPELTGELYIRWFQFSAFCPLFRSHGRTWKLRLPWGWDTGNYGPAEVPASALPSREELHNVQVEPICRKYLNLRYRLLPYLYTLVREAHDTGWPIMRALWFHYPADPHALERCDEYLWGPSLLIAPVVEKGARARKLYLPQGKWYDFWTEELIDGGREITRPVDLATMPIYARAGTILPMGPVKQFATESLPEPIDLVVYPGTNARMDLYEDDGLTFNFRRGEFTWTRAIWEDRGRRLTLTQAGMKRRHRARFRVRILPERSNRLISQDREVTTVQL